MRLLHDSLQDPPRLPHSRCLTSCLHNSQHGQTSFPQHSIPGRCNSFESRCVSSSSWRLPRFPSLHGLPQHVPSQCTPLCPLCPRALSTRVEPPQAPAPPPPPRPSTRTTSLRRRPPRVDSAFPRATPSRSAAPRFPCQAQKEPHQGVSRPLSSSPTRRSSLQWRRRRLPIEYPLPVLSRSFLFLLLRFRLQAHKHPASPCP